MLARPSQRMSKENRLLVSRSGRGRPSNATDPSSERSATMRAIWENLVCGAVARFAQNVTTYPIDTIKTRVQVSRFIEYGHSGKFARIRAALQKGSLYRGLPLSLLGNVPYGMITFGLYVTYFCKYHLEAFSTILSLLWAMGLDATFAGPQGIDNPFAAFSF